MNGLFERLADKAIQRKDLEYLTITSQSDGYKEVTFGFSNNTVRISKLQPKPVIDDEGSFAQEPENNFTHD